MALDKPQQPHERRDSPGRHDIGMQRRDGFSPGAENARGDPGSAGRCGKECSLSGVALHERDGESRAGLSGSDRNREAWEPAAASQVNPVSGMGRTELQKMKRIREMARSQRRLLAWCDQVDRPVPATQLVEKGIETVGRFT